MTTAAPTALRLRVQSRLPSVPASVTRGRRAAVDAAAPLLSERALGDFALLISEILTNAVRHGGADEILLAVTPKDHHLCVQVTDSGDGFVPVPRAMATGDDGGFGLFLVERLTRRWGMTRESGRTRVWFEFDLR